MKANQKKPLLILTAILIALASGAFYYFLKAGHGGKNPSITTMTAPVSAAKACQGYLERKMTFYGKVMGSPAGTRKIALNFDAAIRNVYVMPGERVSRGKLILEAAPSASSELAINEAENAYKSSAKNLSFVRRKYALRVATRQDILNAKEAYIKAKIKYFNARKYFNPEVYSPISGVIGGIFCSRGNIIPAGKPLASIIGMKSLIIKCGAEPERLKYLNKGQAAEIAFSGNKSIVHGKIFQIAGNVDAKTGLVDFYVSPKFEKKFFPVLPGSVARVNINCGKVKGLIIPEASILKEGEKYFVYLIEKGRAKKVYVSVFLQNQVSALVKGNVKNGDMLVSGGGYELSPGMKVRIIKKAGAAR